MERSILLCDNHDKFGGTDKCPKKRGYNVACECRDSDKEASVEMKDNLGEVKILLAEPKLKQYVKDEHVKKLQKSFKDTYPFLSDDNCRTMACFRLIEDGEITRLMAEEGITSREAQKRFARGHARALWQFSETWRNAIFKKQRDKAEETEALYLSEFHKFKTERKIDDYMKAKREFEREHPEMAEKKLSALQTLTRMRR